MVAKLQTLYANSKHWGIENRKLRESKAGETLLWLIESESSDHPAREREAEQNGGIG